MSEWVLSQSGAVVYVLLFLMLIGGALGLPIPEDLPLILAGVLVNNGSIDLKIVFIVCYCGILLGDLIIYAVGRKFGPALFNQSWFKSKISSRRIKLIRLNLERRSIVMIFLARHLFYLRTVTFLVCGAVKMRPTRFLIADSIAALVSAPIMIAVGYLFSEHYSAILQRFSEAKFIFGIVLPFVIVGAVVFYVIRKRRAAIETDDDQIS